MQPSRQISLTGKPHGTHICVPYKPAGNTEPSRNCATAKICHPVGAVIPANRTNGQTAGASNARPYNQRDTCNKIKTCPLSGHTESQLLTLNSSKKFTTFLKHPPPESRTIQCSSKDRQGAFQNPHNFRGFPPRNLGRFFSCFS